VRVFRDLLEYGFQGSRKATEALELFLVGIQFLTVWQFAPKQKVSDFFKLGFFSQVGDVIATVCQAGTTLANGTQGGFASYLATEACAA
jgi:hypothetical protein